MKLTTTMILRYLKDLITWIALMLAGFFVYILAKRDMNIVVGRGFGKFVNPKIDAIWGNYSDGLTGDAPYREKEAKTFFRKFCPSYIWTCYRNPCGNWKRNLVNGVITVKQKTGNLTLAVINDKSYFFYYNKNDKVMVKLGYKIWDSYKLGENVQAKLAVSVAIK